MPEFTSTSRRRRVLVLFLVLAAAIPLAVLAPQATAQGTSGVLPDPIRGRDLTAYATRLKLSDQQRLAVDSYHERYLDDFRVLREGEITEFLEKAGNVMRTFMFSPDSKEAQKYLDQLERLMTDIKRLDQRLFDQMQTLLSEDQTPALLRVRQMRERARYSSGIVRFIGYSNPGARVDLSALVDDVDLPPEERDAVDPLVQVYEGELTRALRKLFDETRAMFEDLLEKMEALTATMQPGRDGRPPRGMWTSMRDILTESSRGVMEQASSISKLNRRSFSSLASVLPEASARALQDEYYEAAYSEVHGPAAAVLGRFDAALQLDGLSVEQRDAVEIARTDLRVQHDGLADRMIDVLEEIRKDGALMRFGGRSNTADQEKLEKLQTRRDEVNETAMERLAAILGVGLHGDLDDAIAARRRAERGGGSTTTVTVTSTSGAGPAVTSVAVTPVERDHASAGVAQGDDPFLPAPISRREVAGYADLLALDEGDRAVVESLHGGYRDAFAALRETHVQPILDAAAALWALDPDTGRIKPPAVEAIDELYELRRAALAAINTLDATFLADVQLLLPEDDAASRMERVRLARARVVYNRGGEGGRGGGAGATNRMLRSFMGGSTDEERADLVEIVTRQWPAGDVRGTLDPVLVEYERGLVDALKRRYELALQVEQASDRAGAESAARRAEAGREGGRDRSFGFGSSFRELMQTTGRELQEVRRAIVTLNRDTLDRLESKLDASAGSALRTAYRRAAYPEIYRDEDSAEPFIRAALGMEDVTAVQRSRISDLLDEFIEPYTELCEKMADLAAESADASFGDFRNRDWQKMQQQRNERDRLRFDRTELNERTRRQLHALLTEQQTQRLGLVVTD